MPPTTTTTITTTTPVTLSDDFSDNNWTSGRLTVGGTASGVVEKDFDKDWFAVTLERGSVYRFGTSVGTGGPIKVPSLVGVGARAPYLHTGCAPTLRDRFTGSCDGGDSHGHTSQLSETELADLIAYLESL